MSINPKQARFLYKIAKLITWAKENEDIDLIGKELFRTKEQAEIHASNGVGIKNSVHRKSLALDMYIYKNGGIVWDKEPYRVLGDEWKRMDIDACWGGDFRRRDAYHFSFEHGGVK